MSQDVSNDLVYGYNIEKTFSVRWWTGYSTQEIASAWISVQNVVWNSL